MFCLPDFIPRLLIVYFRIICAYELSFFSLFVCLFLTVLTALPNSFSPFYCHYVKIWHFHLPVFIALCCPKFRDLRRSCSHFSPSEDSLFSHVFHNHSQTSNFASAHSQPVLPVWPERQPEDLFLYLLSSHFIETKMSPGHFKTLLLICSCYLPFPVVF